MFQNIYELNIDIKFVTRNRLPIFVQGDTGGFRIKLFDNAIPFNLAQFTRLEVTFQSPSRTTIVDVGEITGDTLVYNFKGHELFENGDHRAIFTLYSGNYTVSTQPIAFVVQDDFRDNNTNYISMLQDLIATVTALEASIEGRIQALDNALASENQRVTNESGRVRSEDERRVNEATRIINENARILAEQQRVANERRRNQTIDNFIFRGAYNRTLTYQPYNVVEYNGSSYVALKVVSNIVPQNNGIDWRIVAQRGVDGSGAVASVNGLLPDLNGNITIPDATNELFIHANNQTDKQHVTFVDKNTTTFANLGLVITPVDNTTNLPTVDPNLYLRPRVDALEASVTTIQGDITTLQGDVINNTTNIANLETRVTDGETHETEVNNRVTTLEGKVNTLETGATAIGGRVTTLENQSTDADNRLDSIEAQLAGGGMGPTLATQAEALAGTNNTAYMSPLRTSEFVMDKAILKTGGVATGNITMNGSSLQVRNAVGSVITDNRINGTVAEQSINNTVYQRVLNEQNVQFRDNTGTFFSIADLKTSVVNGKNSIASAITDKGVPSNGNKTFDELATDIRAIPSGGGGGTGNTVTKVSGFDFYGGVISGIRVVAAYDDGTIWTRNSSNNLTRAGATGGSLTVATNVGEVVGIGPNGNSYYRTFNPGNFEVNEYNFQGVEISSRTIPGFYPGSGTVTHAVSKDGLILHTFDRDNNLYEARNILSGNVISRVNTNAINAENFTTTVSDNNISSYSAPSSVGGYGLGFFVPSNPNPANVSNPVYKIIDMRALFPVLGGRVTF